MRLRKSKKIPAYYLAETKNKDESKWIKSFEVLEQNIEDLKFELNAIFSPSRTKHSHSWGMYFRGQKCITHGLVPSAGRSHWYAGRSLSHFNPSQERNMLHRFRRASYKHFNRILSNWEALFLARHYELPTRLLDWTRDPFIALYFACLFDDRPKKDGALWVFVRCDEEDWDVNVLSGQSLPKEGEYGKDFQFGIEGVKILYPFCVTERITAQTGIFTIQEDPKTPLEEYDRDSYKRQHFDVLLIRKWKVPKDSKRKLLKDIHERGINASSLFPDIQGLAEGIWQTEVMRSGRTIKEPKSTNCRTCP